MNMIKIHNQLESLKKNRFDSEDNLRYIEIGGFEICINNGFQIKTPNGAVRHFKQHEANAFLLKKIGA